MNRFNLDKCCLGQIFSRLIVLGCCLAMLGCTSLRPVQLPGAAATGDDKPLVAQLAPGDKVHVVLKSGAEIMLVVSGSTEYLLSGDELEFGTVVTLNTADIVSVKRREWDALKTVGLVLLCLIAVAAYAQAAGYSKILGTV